MSAVKKLEQLNEYQRAAVLDDSQACIVNANVGSGKTTVLISKIQYLHEEKQIPYDDMVVLTFTNKAANEIRERLSETQEKLRYFGTFHSVAYTLLREELDVTRFGYTKEFTVMDPEEELELAMELIRREKLKIKYANRLRKRLEQEKVSKYQDDLMKLKDLLEEEKKQKNQMTFTNLMNYAVELLKEQPKKLRYVIVDEVQDCDGKQLEFMEILAGAGARLFAVGDPNQEIYGFRGNVINVFYTLREKFGAKELTLPINYRSSAAILGVSRYFLQRGNRLEGVKETGHKVRCKRQYNSFGEANYLAGRIRDLHEEGVAYGDIAIFYRLQEQSQSLSQVFDHEGIPYAVTVKKAAALLGHGNTESEASETVDAVRLMTLHASKGLEFSHVFIIGVNNGLIPLQAKRFEDDEEEHRLFFVGMTRAENELELSYYTNPDTLKTMPGPSRYLKMIPPEYMEWEDDVAEKVDLQDLKRQILQEKKMGKEATEAATVAEAAVAAEKQGSGSSVPQNQQPAMERKVSHAKYGIGVVVAEDDVMLTAVFEGYGEKEFVKAFSELEDIENPHESLVEVMG